MTKIVATSDIVRHTGFEIIFFVIIQGTIFFQDFLDEDNKPLLKRRN
jgi:hypothetical protein